MSGALSSSLSEISVDNVFLYVADAVRSDALPERVASRGLRTRGVASSIHSPTSFASLVSGLYPPATGVFSFSHRVDSKTLFDTDGVHTCYESTMLEGGGTDDSLFSVFGLDPAESHGTLADAPEPFVALERGNGGHAPYGTSTLTAWEYFRQRGNASSATFRSEYESRIEQDTDRFLERLDTLADRDLSEDTLVIYTADHGELLGEGGLLGHNGPIRPELVYVPVVFIHPDLPENESVSTLVRHVDLLPTILDLVGADDSRLDEFDGCSLVSESPGPYGLSFYESGFFTGRVPGLSGTLSYESLWGPDGGHVFANSPRRDRMAVLGGKLLKSAKREFLARHLPEATRSYFRGNRSYGTPPVDVRSAEAALATARENAVSSTEIELSGDASDRLRDLGYL